ncbi:MAG: acyl-CoA thioesterase [Synechococcus sp.]|nr:acyl-CoA thioesterase [Synechococcus sp.]
MPASGSGSDAPPAAPSAWCLRRVVLPQHTDHAGVMWHGSYLAWLEEGRVEALAAAGLAYSDLAARGLELPVVSLAIDYRQPLLHGDRVELWSEALPRQGARLPWRSRFLGPGGVLAAEARVELVPVALAPGGEGRRLLRRLPEDLAEALRLLEAGPAGTDPSVA